VRGIFLGNHIGVTLAHWAKYLSADIRVHVWWFRGGSGSDAARSNLPRD
jgi:hypothetical protein